MASPPVEQQTPQEVTEQPVAQEPLTPAPAVDQTPTGQSSGSSLVQRMSDEEPAPETTDAPVAMSRPMPLSRNQAALKSKSTVSISEQVKRVVSSHKAKMDPRQRKMTVVVGILSVAFAAVLFISLGGLSGQSGPAAANAATESATDQAAATVETVDNWKRPQPIPATLRDPMTPAARNVQDAQSGPGQSQTPGQVTVRGIVFSKTRPTAIINETIMAEGESLNGVTIVNIEKDSVEFEKDGKRWTQQVQR
jgi:hypothetical protein